MIEEGKLVELLGPGNVISDQTKLKEYSRDISFVNTIKPEYIVKPRNKEDIAKIVKLANETMTPLVPVSSGQPHFRGDSIPGTGGSIVVDLSGMKKILRVDRPHRVAMCESGVTFDELIPAVTKEGLRINLPLLPKKSKSVVTSMLEREPVIMPKYQWDISDPLACLEVVFGTGDDFRTGQAAGPGTIEEQWAAGAVQKAPYGPGPIFWHKLVQGAQGTMGIVTWASLRCELLPELEEAFTVGSSYLDRLFELSHWLVRLRLVNECFILNNSTLASIMAKSWPGDYQTIKNSLPTWILFYNVAGYEYYSEDRVNYQVKNIQGITQRVGVEAARAVAGISARELLKVVQQPCEDPYWKLRYKGACQDIFFLTNYDNLPGQVDTMYEEANKAGYPVSDIGIYIQPLVQGTSCHCEFNLYYDPGSRDELTRVQKLSSLAIKHLMGKGAFFSRPYGVEAKMILNKNAANVVALNKVKKIVDPNNIMNPGKLCF
jgi:hypothetical protein